MENSLSVSEAMLKAKVSRPTLYEWIRKKHFEASQAFGGVWEIDKESFETFLKSRK